MTSIKYIFFITMISVCHFDITTSELPASCNGTAKFQGPMREGYMRMGGNVVSTIPNTRSLLDCISSCTNTAGCVSVNFVLTSRDCELNDEISLTDDDLVVSNDTTYYALNRKLL